MADDIIQNFGFLTLGSRLKRIGEALQADTQRIVDSYGLGIQPSHYPVLAAIDREGPLTIGELAASVGISQPGITRTAGLLEKQGLLQVIPSEIDQRRRVVTLTAEGQKLVDLSKARVWPRIERSVRDLCAGLSGPLLNQLAHIERGLAETPLGERASDMERPEEHPLDRPVWSALMTSHARFARGGSLARRFEPGHIPFVAMGMDDGESLRAAAALIPAGETLYIVQQQPIGEVPGTQTLAEAKVVQMICEQPVAPLPHDDIERLSGADAEEMSALATLTKPGPFSLRAGELGEFWGVRIDGRLAAMAGTRFVTGTFTELSGVCTHPDFQGRGLGRRLSVFVARRFIDRGETPFLHAFDTNQAAIGLYESIGFRIRTKLNVKVVRRP
jgi:DNA-binding MarR family transcriptional regulator/ribosomal protein S18 acetylase RimI-like enzyme